MVGEGLCRLPSERQKDALLDQRGASLGDPLSNDEKDEKDKQKGFKGSLVSAWLLLGPCTPAQLGFNTAGPLHTRLCSLSPLSSKDANARTQHLSAKGGPVRVLGESTRLNGADGRSHRSKVFETLNASCNATCLLDPEMINTQERNVCNTIQREREREGRWRGRWVFHLTR